MITLLCFLFSDVRGVQAIHKFVLGIYVFQMDIQTAFAEKVRNTELWIYVLSAY